MVTTVKLPPSQRDFEVYHFLKEGGSTRSAAVRFGVSQTRVRQLARRVVTWAADALPPDTEAETAGLLRVAVSVAGDRLDYFYQQTMEQWHATHQVKFLGLAIRITQAAARLPIRSCEIDAAAADLLEPEEEEQGSGVGRQESARREPRPMVAALEAETPLNEDCSAENSRDEVADVAPVADRDASPPAASSSQALAGNGEVAERQRIPQARTLLTAPRGAAASVLEMSPEALGLSVEETLRRFERRKRRAK